MWATNLFYFYTHFYGHKETILDLSRTFPLCLSLVKLIQQLRLKTIYVLRSIGNLLKLNRLILSLKITIPNTMQLKWYKYMPSEIAFTRAKIPIDCKEGCFCVKSINCNLIIYLIVAHCVGSGGCGSRFEQRLVTSVCACNVVSEIWNLPTDFGWCVCLSLCVCESSNVVNKIVSTL